MEDTRGTTKSLSINRDALLNLDGVGGGDALSDVALLGILLLSDVALFVILLVTDGTFLCILLVDDVPIRVGGGSCLCTILLLEKLGNLENFQILPK